MNQPESAVGHNNMHVSSAAAAAGRLLMSIIFVEWIAEAWRVQRHRRLYGKPESATAGTRCNCRDRGGMRWRIAPARRISNPWVGLALAVWCVATALVARSHVGEPEQAINFLKNLAMCGGFLQLVAFGGGNWSLDARKG